MPIEWYSFASTTPKNYQRHTPRPAIFAAPGLLFAKRLIEDGVHRACQTRGGKPTREAFRAVCWLRRADDTAGSFHWCCTWLGIFGCRALFQKSNSTPHIPGEVRLRQRLEALQDPLHVGQVAHELLAHVCDVWAGHAVREPKKRVAHAQQPRRELSQTMKAEIKRLRGLGLNSVGVARATAMPLWLIYRDQHAEEPAEKPSP